MENIIIDGIKYIPENTETETDNEDKKIKIVILQRGWIMVGYFERKENNCRLTNASIVRKWGTTQGLGELAEKGKLSETILDKCYNPVEFDYLTVVATIECNQKKWKTEL